MKKKKIIIKSKGIPKSWSQKKKFQPRIPLTYCSVGRRVPLVFYNFFLKYCELPFQLTFKIGWKMTELWFFKTAPSSTLSVCGPKLQMSMASRIFFFKDMKIRIRTYFQHMKHSTKFDSESKYTVDRRYPIETMAWDFHSVSCQDSHAIMVAKHAIMVSDFTNKTKCILYRLHTENYVSTN